MSQQVELTDGEARIGVTRDRGQWMLDVCPPGWSETVHLGELLAAMRLEHLPTDTLSGALPEQLPPGETWTECLPTVFAWAAGRSYRLVFVEVERQRYGTRNFGGRGRAPSLRQIERWTTTLAQAVAASSGYLPTYGSSEDLARAHIEVASKSMAFVVVERGEELERTTFSETVDLLEHAFRGITFNMAVDWEVEHRSEAEDFRRRLWAKQLVLLERLHPLWAGRLATTHSAKFRDVGLDPGDAASIVAQVGPTSD